MLMTVTISLRSRRSLKNCEKDLTWFKGAGFQLVVLHRWIGNPFFSLLVRKWFRAPINDVYCGLRGFTKAMYERLDQRCTGMEFATEMIIKARLRGEKIAEVPITLCPDKHTSHAPHLKTFRDGWRTFRYFLMCSPRWLFVVPGGVFIAFGLLGYLVAMPGLRIGHSTFDAHTLLFASLAILCGYQCILFAIFAKTFATTEGFLPPDRHLERFFEVVNLEKGLVVAALAVLAGGSLLLVAVWQWWLTGFGHLDYARTMRFVVSGATLVALGFKRSSPAFSSASLGRAANESYRLIFPGLGTVVVQLVQKQESWIFRRFAQSRFRWKRKREQNKIADQRYLA